MDEVTQEIRQFVFQLVPNGNAAKLCDDTPLRTSGFLDSMGQLRLVSMVEEKFGFEVSAYEAIEYFNRIDDIAAFVARKRMAKA